MVSIAAGNNIAPMLTYFIFSFLFMMTLDAGTVITIPTATTANPGTLVQTDFLGVSIEIGAESLLLDISKVAVQTLWMNIINAFGAGRFLHIRIGGASTQMADNAFNTNTKYLGDVDNNYVKQYGGVDRYFDFVNAAASNLKQVQFVIGLPYYYNPVLGVSNAAGAGCPAFDPNKHYMGTADSYTDYPPANTKRCILADPAKPNYCTSTQAGSGAVSAYDIMSAAARKSDFYNRLLGFELGNEMTDGWWWHCGGYGTGIFLTGGTNRYLYNGANCKAAFLPSEQFSTQKPISWLGSVYATYYRNAVSRLGTHPSFVGNYKYFISPGALGSSYFLKGNQCNPIVSDILSNPKPAALTGAKLMGAVNMHEYTFGSSGNVTIEFPKMMHFSFSDIQNGTGATNFAIAPRAYKIRFGEMAGWSGGKLSFTDSIGNAIWVLHFSLSAAFKKFDGVNFHNCFSYTTLLGVRSDAYNTLVFGIRNVTSGYYYIPASAVAGRAWAVTASATYYGLLAFAHATRSTDGTRSTDSRIVEAAAYRYAHATTTTTTTQAVTDVTLVEPDISANNVELEDTQLLVYTIKNTGNKVNLTPDVTVVVISRCQSCVRLYKVNFVFRYVTATAFTFSVRKLYTTLYESEDGKTSTPLNFRWGTQNFASPSVDSVGTTLAVAMPGTSETGTTDPTQPVGTFKIAIMPVAAYVVQLWLSGAPLTSTKDSDDSDAIAQLFQENALAIALSAAVFLLILIAVYVRRSATQKAGGLQINLKQLYAKAAVDSNKKLMSLAGEPVSEPQSPA